MKIKALIPARAGSERVKLKNTRAFCGSSLLEMKITQLRTMPEVSEVIVNSESDHILSVAESAGATPHKRDEAHARSDSPMSEVYRAMVEPINAEHILYCNCTNPFVRTATIRDIIQTWEEVAGRGAIDSVNCATAIKGFAWYCGKPVNYDPSNMPKSQTLTPVLFINYAVNALAKKTILENGNVTGLCPLLVQVDEIEGWDIDTKEDFDIAEFLMHRKKIMETTDDEQRY